MQIFAYLLDRGGDAESARKALKIEKQSTDSGAVLAFVNQVLDANPQSILDFKAGKDRAIGFLVGQVMKLSKGKVNPAAVSKTLQEEIKKR